MDPDGGGLGVGGAAGVQARVVHLGVLQREGADGGAVVVCPHAHLHLLHLVVGYLLDGCGMEGCRGGEGGREGEGEENRAEGVKVEKRKTL